MSETQNTQELEVPVEDQGMKSEPIYTDIPNPGTGLNAMREMTMVEWAEQMRNTLKFDEQQARALVKKLKDSTEELYDKGEMIAQAMLALRHIEDARMRFGKVIQYADMDKKGESVYPR